MARSIRLADLVARALDLLPAEERTRIDRALEADPVLRQRFEEIGGHLVLYDSLPPAPPPPPFERLAAALDEEVAPDPRILELPGARRAWARPLGLAAAAAAILIALILWAPERRPGTADDLSLVAGPGLVLRRGSEVLPTPQRARRPVLPGDLLTCDRPAEARLGGRVHVVLDAQTSLAIVDREVVHLEAGRAWFEVGAGPFEVRTAHGPVRVLGTVFEIDLRSGRLDVCVDSGQVVANGREISAGLALSEGRIERRQFAPGAWFRKPRLHLENAGSTPLRIGEPLELRLVFTNPSHVPLRIEGPDAVRTPVWVGFETPEGRVLREMPVLSSNVLTGLDLLTPGGAAVLEAGGRAVLTVRILPPLGSPGAYRCRALYRPEDQPVVLSSPLTLEVR